nr:hypothetical protein CFP56_34332 [Quercus suber]
MRWVEKLEIYERNRPERLTPFDSISIKTVSALLSEDGKVLLRDNGDRFCLFHDLGIPLIYHGALLQKIASVAASARGSRMPIFVDLLRLVKRAIKIPMTIHDVVISFNDEYEVVSVTIVLDPIEAYEPKPIPAAESSIMGRTQVMRLEESLYVGNSHDNEPTTTSYEQISLHRKSVWLPKHEVLLQGNGDRLSSSLCDFDIPVENHDPVLQEIASVAGSAGTSRMPIVVILLRMVKLVMEEIIDDDDEDEDSNEEEEDEEVARNKSRLSLVPIPNAA